MLILNNQGRTHSRWKWNGRASSAHGLALPLPTASASGTVASLVYPGYSFPSLQSLIYIDCRLSIHCLISILLTWETSVSVVYWSVLPMISLLLFLRILIFWLSFWVDHTMPGVSWVAVSFRGIKWAKLGCNKLNVALLHFFKKWCFKRFLNAIKNL